MQVRGNNSCGFENNICAHLLSFCCCCSQGRCLSPAYLVSALLALLLVPVQHCLPCLWGEQPSSSHLFWPLITRFRSTFCGYNCTLALSSVAFWERGKGAGLISLCHKVCQAPPHLVPSYPLLNCIHEVTSPLWEPVWFGFSVLSLRCHSHPSGPDSCLSCFRFLSSPELLNHLDCTQPYR